MPTTIRSFAKNMLDLSRGLSEATGGILAEVSERVHGTLVLATPVDRSGDADHIQAQSNWLVAINTADLTFAALSSEVDSIHAGQTILRSKTLKATDVVVIANGGDKIPYLERLNRGWSSQAPAGFVERAIEIGARVAAEVRLIRETNGGPITYSKRRVT